MMNTTEKNNFFRSNFSTSTHGSTGECHCGVFHYDEANEWDEDHHKNVIPSAKEAQKENPDSYQFHDTAIEYLNFNGFLFVIGCRCKMDDFIFDFLVEDKDIILTFYKSIKDRINLEDIE